MITIIGAPLSSADTFTVSGSIILRDDSGDGIQKVDVRDRFGVLIHSETFTCPSLAEIHLVDVERDRLPLMVEAMNCKGQTFPATTPVWTREGDVGSVSIPLPGSALLCTDNPACSAAEGAATRARNEIMERCNDVRAVRGRRDAAAAVATALATAVVALVATGIAAFAIPLFGTAIGAVLLGLAAGLAYLAGVQALIAFREQQNLDKAEADLAAARRRFTDAADRVGRMCSRDCITVDLTQPAC